MNRTLSFVRASLLGALLLVTHDGWAGRQVLADQGNNYAGDGQSWPLTLTQAGTSQTLPFAIDIGNGPALLTFTTKSDGSIDFGNGNFINVAKNSFGWKPATAISNDRGRVDPSLLDSTLAPNFSADPNVAGLDAYRFLWNGVCINIPNANCPTPESFEAVIYNLAPEVFVLQFNYGSDAFPIDPSNPIPGLTGGFLLGRNTNPDGPGFVDEQQPDFCFNQGVSSVFTTIRGCLSATAVPEPPVAPLVLIGMLGIVLMSTARRRRPNVRKS